MLLPSCGLSVVLVCHRHALKLQGQLQLGNDFCLCTLRRWTNYFLHSGHLNIDGLKMSKSLKNFIKIEGALQKFGARRLRLLFLLQRYNAPMNYRSAQQPL